MNNQNISEKHKKVLTILKEAKTALSRTDLCNRLCSARIIGDEKDALLNELHDSEMIQIQYEYTGKPGRKPVYISLTARGDAVLTKKNPEQVGA